MDILDYASKLHQYLLPVVILTVFIAIAATFLTFRWLRQRKKRRKWQMSAFAVLGFVWLTAALIIITIINPSIHHRHLISNPTVLISTFKAFLAVYVVLITLFLERLLKWQFIKRTNIKSKRIFWLTDLMLWILAVSIIIRIALRNPSTVFDFTLLRVAKVKITVIDLISVTFILILTQILLIFIKNFFDRQIETKKLDQGTGVALYRLSSYFIWTISIVLAIEAMGFDITLLLAGSAALLVGLGMGIQQLFLDFVSGIILLTERNVSVGDVVEVNGIVGKIVDLGFRTTIIQTRDNVRIIVPNSKLTSDNIINWTHSERDTRFNVTVGVAYGSDVDLVIRLLLNIANEHPKIKKSPKPFVRFEDFGDSALIFSLYFFTDHTFYVENIKSDLRIAIDRVFREHNITIPFPQRDVHLFMSPEKQG